MCLSSKNHKTVYLIMVYRKRALKGAAWGRFANKKERSPLARTPLS
jgi:hypothetical protein